MKIISRSLYDFQAKELLEPIRNKFGCIRTLLKCSRILLLNNLEKELSPFALHVKIDKMSRLFIETPTRIVSFAFPFHIDNTEEEVNQIYTHLETTVDNMAISAALSILTNAKFDIKPSIIEYSYEADRESSIGLELLDELVFFEPSYIRYDIDPENMNGHLHPLNHIDINYSNYGTFKIGCKKQISLTQFEDILNLKTDCIYFD